MAGNQFCEVKTFVQKKIFQSCLLVKKTASFLTETIEIMAIIQLRMARRVYVVCNGAV